jgi:hypothetical protein
VFLERRRPARYDLARFDASLPSVFARSGSMNDNPYAAPQPSTHVAQSTDTPGAWRSGKMLVVNRQAVLPDRCVRCNAPAEGYRKRKVFSWFPPLLALTLLLGFIPFLFIVLIASKKMPIRYGVCAAHVRQRRNTMLFAWLGAIASFVIMIGGAVLPGNAALVSLLGLVSLIVAILYGMFASRHLTPKRIDKQHAWLLGVSPDYLSSLPEFPA